MDKASSRNFAQTNLRKVLDRHLSLLAPGDPLPPVRSLMSTHRTNQQRLSSVLEQLEADGLIERRARKGIFKAREKSGDQVHFMVDVVDCGVLAEVSLANTFGADLAHALAAEAGRRGRGIRMHQLQQDEPIEVYVALASRSDMQACVLCYMRHLDVLRVFRKHHVICVPLLPDTVPEECEGIVDSPDMVRLQLEHLWHLQTS